MNDRGSAAGRLSRGAAPNPSFYEGQDLEALADIPNYYNWILRRFRPYLHGSVIEIGAGVGHISALYADSVDKLLLIEPAKNLHQQLTQRFASTPHVQTTCAVLEDLHLAETKSPGAYGGPFDAAILVNVLEHVEDDVTMLRQTFDLLREGGALLIFVPALPWLYGTLDARVHHLRRYTRRTLTQVIQQAGFELEWLRYFDFAGILAWFIAGRLIRQKGHNPAAAKLYDRFVVPVGSRVEKAVRLPFGKNLISVARRPSPRAP